MPACVLTTSSVLLTADGWQRADWDRKEIPVVGIDRHGARVLRPLTTELTSTPIENCFLGTRTSFGAFHPLTKLIDASGNSISAGSIVDAENLDAVRFENGMDISNVFNSEEAFDRLWKEFRKISLVDWGKEVFLRVLKPSLFPDQLQTPWFERADQDLKYIIVRRDQLSTALRLEGSKILISVLESLLARERGILEIERANYPIALWLASACRLENKGYCLNYDTLQHTATVSFQLDAPFESTGQARTAFYGDTACVTRAKWDERSWNPLSAGFIIGGE